MTSGVPTAFHAMIEATNFDDARSRDPLGARKK